MGHRNAQCEHDVTKEVDPVCPECGTPFAERSPAIPWAVRYRSVVKFGSLGLVLGFIVWQNVLAWPVLGTPRTYSTYPARALAHKYTQADLEQYASGEIADGQLANDVTSPFLIGTLELEAALVSPDGTVVTMVYYGWPTIILLYQSFTDYDDVYAKTNPSPGGRISKSGWRGLSYTRQHIDAENRFQHFGFPGHQLIVPLVVVVLAFSFGRGLCAVLIVSRVAQKNGNRLHDRFTRRVPVLCAIACTIGVTIASLQPSRYPDQILLGASTVAATKTGITTADIARLTSSPTGEVEIARAILDAVGGTTADPDDVLVVGWSSDVAMTVVESNGGWPDAIYFYTRSFSEDLTIGRNSRARISVIANFTTLDIAVRWGNPPVRIDDHSFVMYNVAKLLLGLYAAWWVPGIAVWLVSWKARRRAAKRVARGWCARCGYDLSGL